MKDYKDDNMYLSKLQMIFSGNACLNLKVVSLVPLHQEAL